MNFFINLKIKTKLIAGFSLVIIFMVSLSIFSITQMQSIDATDTHALEFPTERLLAMERLETNVVDMRRLTASMSTYATTNDNARTDQYYKEAVAAYNEALAQADRYAALSTSDPKLTPAEINSRTQNASQIKDYLNQYKAQVVDEINTASRNADHELSLEILIQGTTIIDTLVSHTTQMLETAKTVAADVSAQATANVNSTITIVIALVVSIVLVSFFLALWLSTIITKPIQQLVDVAENVAKGNLNVNINTTRMDETGMLGKSFYSVVQNVNTIISDINTMYHQHEDGHMNDRISDDRYQGAYRDVAVGVNEMVASYVDMINDIFRVLSSFAAGAFDAKLKPYKGEKAVANEQMTIFRDTIAKIVKEIDVVARDGADGKLSTRAEADQYTGDWKNIMLGLNKVMDAVIAPINEVQASLLDVSKGNFDTSVRGDYRGAFAEMKNAMNNTVTSIASYIKEITEILGKIAGGDLRTSIHRDYIGQFNYIKESINAIVSTLHKTMTEILSASDQVLAGAKQISASSMTLAEGASEQASSVQQLTASVETINNQTQQNASNAATANELSDKSTQNAQAGNDEMQNMLKAMNDIKDSSNSISKVISTISEIAFQTNLLALNASVEAARAGEHGRGFAVVADEVRNLASKSQVSSNDTATLIENSNARVNEGTKIAQATANALNVIVENAAQVSGIINTIAEASRNQAEAISQVSIGLAQISQVVQNNSSTSEESAAAAQELNSQAELLQQMVAYFKI